MKNKIDFEKLSPYIRGQLADTTNKNVEGFIITDEDSLVPTAFYCPWVGHYHNIVLPNVIFNIHRMPDGWREELIQFTEIEALYVLTDIQDLDFIRNFTNLKELYIFENICKDLNFFEELMELDTLYVQQAPDFDTAPIRKLLEKQLNRRERIRADKSRHILPLPRVLDEVALIYCNLTADNLKDFAVNRSFSELNFSHNNIENITHFKDVDVYYFILRYNQLTDLEPIQYMPYYLNARHNEISELPEVEKMKNSCLSRLFLAHNRLSAQQIKQLKKLNLLATDLF